MIKNTNYSLVSKYNMSGWPSGTLCTLYICMFTSPMEKKEKKIFIRKIISEKDIYLPTIVIS